MKRLFTFLFAVIVMIVFGGCKNIHIQNEDSETTATSIEIITETKESIANITTIQTTEPLQAIEPDITINNIIMTDDEIYELGIMRANELSNLFNDYLHGDVNKLNIFYNENKTLLGKYISPDGNEYDELFYVVEDDKIKTYNDLYNLFNNTCTPEFSTKLLKFVTHQYSDIDGTFCFMENVFSSWMLSCDRDELVSFEINNNQIKLNFLVNIYPPVEDAKPYAQEYSIILENLNDEWLVSDSTDILYHGYFWNVS